MRAHICHVGVRLTLTLALALTLNPNPAGTTAYKRGSGIFNPVHVDAVTEGCSLGGTTVHANAVRQRAAAPQQYASGVAAIAARLGDLPKADASCREERERLLEANRTMEAGPQHEPERRVFRWGPPWGCV